jgi:hypothetical protein
MCSKEQNTALRELVAKWRKNALPHLDRWQCANELEAFIEREAAASLSPRENDQHALAVRALDAAALWEPERLLELADTIERAGAVCEGQYLRTIARRLQSRAETEDKKE